MLISTISMNSYPLLLTPVYFNFFKKNGSNLLVHVPLVSKCMQFVSLQTDGSSELLHLWSSLQNGIRGIWSTLMTFIPRLFHSDHFTSLIDDNTRQRGTGIKRQRRKIWGGGGEEVVSMMFQMCQIQVRVYEYVCERSLQCQCFVIVWFSTQERLWDIRITVSQ